MAVGIDDPGYERRAGRVQNLGRPVDRDLGFGPGSDDRRILHHHDCAF
jgi:hypothetical protein